MPYLDGIASGLDTTSLIRAVMEVAEAPLKRMQGNLDSLEDVKEAVAGLTNRFEDLSTALQGVDEVAEFSLFSATVSNTSALSATVDSDVAPGQYDVLINNLASSETEVSQAFADSTSTGVIGEGTFKVTYGGVETDITLDSSNSSLTGLATALNEVEGISAYVLDTGVATDPYKLVVQGQDTGTTNSISFDTSGLTGGTALSFTQTTEAKNASATVNGTTVESETNTLDNIPGLTLDLLSDPGETVSITVNQDTEGMADKIQAVVDAYNEIESYYDTKTAYNTELGISGPLLAESGSRRAVDALKDMFTGDYSAMGGSFSTLSQIGITLEQDGSLALDRTVLVDAIESDSDGVFAMFSEDGGPGKTLVTAIDDLYVDEDTGILTTRSDSIEEQIEDLQEDIDRKDALLDSQAERLRDQFVQMEIALAEMQSTGSYLAAMFAGSPSLI